MMKREERALKGGIGLLLAVLAVCAAGVTAQAQNPLGYFPEGATAALYLPSIDFLEQKAAPVAEAAGLDAAGELTGMLGDLPSKLGVAPGAPLSEVFKAAGLDTSKPAALFVKKPAAGMEELGALIPVANAETAAEKMKSIFDSDPAEYAEGDAKGFFNDTQSLGFAVLADKVLLGSTKDMIKGMAARAAAPYQSPYETGAEVALVTSITRLQDAGVFPATAPNGQPLAAVYDYLKGIMGEVVLAAGEAEGESYVRLAMAAPSGAVTPPADSLKMHTLFPESSPVVFNLRNDAAFMQAVRPLIMASPQAAKVGGYITLISGMIGKEVGLALTGVKDGMPDGMLAMDVAKPESIKMLMGMAGAKDGPKEQINGADIYAFENVYEGLSLFLATKGASVIATTNMDALKASLEKLDAGSTATPVSQKTLDRGNNGFIAVNGGKLSADAAAALPLPATVDLSEVVAEVTLGGKGPWNELRVSVPGDMKGIAEWVTSAV